VESQKRDVERIRHNAIFRKKNTALVYNGFQTSDVEEKERS